MRITPDIILPRNAEEALAFHKGIFGGESEIMRWGEMPPDPQMPGSDAWQSKIMHGSLTISEDVEIYLADSWAEGEGTYANNVYLHVEFDSEEELRKAYDTLSEGGKVNMPVDQTFWGAIYGDLAGQPVLTSSAPAGGCTASCRNRRRHRASGASRSESTGRRQPCSVPRALVGAGREHNACRLR